MIPTVFLCVGVLFASGLSEQWLTTNRNSSFEYRPLEYFCMLSRRPSRFCASFVVVLFDDAGKVRICSSVTVTQRFYYLAYPVLGCYSDYSQFSLLDISSYWLLHSVSSNKHYLHFYSSIPLLNISITRRFSVPIVFPS